MIIASEQFMRTRTNEDKTKTKLLVNFVGGELTPKQIEVAIQRALPTLAGNAGFDALAEVLDAHAAFAAEMNALKTSKAYKRLLESDQMELVAELEAEFQLAPIPESVTVYVSDVFPEEKPTRGRKSSE